MSTSSKDYTVKTILKAIKGCGGIVSTVAKRLKCDWNTADKYIKMYDETKQAIQDEKETILDMAEGVLYESIKEKDVQSAKWLLSVMGKKRGFSEKLQLEHSGEVTIIDDISNE
jgi:hypothetical protein